MSETSEHGAMAGAPKPAGKVGYRKPPQEHRFEKGRSGNPNGRPRKQDTDAGGSLSQSDRLLLKEGSRLVKGIENGKVRKISVKEYSIRSLAKKVFQGNVQATCYINDRLSRAEERKRKEDRKSFEQLVAYKRRSANEIHRRELEGFESPKFVPHPADMFVDSKQERVIIIGPRDDIEEAEWDESEAERGELQSFIAHLEEVLVGPKRGLKDYSGSRELVSSLIEETKESLADLDAAYPSKEQRRKPGYILDWLYRQKGNGRGSPADGSIVHVDKAKPTEGKAERQAPQTSDGARENKPTSPSQGFGSCSGSRNDVRARFEDSKKALAAVKAAYDAENQQRQPDANPEQHPKQEKRGSSHSTAGPTVHAAQAKPDDSVTERQELGRRIKYLQEQLTRPEETLDPQFETHMCAVNLLEQIKERLRALDDVDPPTGQGW